MKVLLAVVLFCFFYAHNLAFANNIKMSHIITKKAEKQNTLRKSKSQDKKLQNKILGRPADTEFQGC